MPVKMLFPGAKYEICAWLDEDGHSHVEEFILELYANNDPDAEAMTDRLQQTSRVGPSSNEQKFRHLQGSGKGLVEFKARGGARVLGFIDQDRRRIVCTHGLPKLKEKQFARWIKKAQKVKEEYLVENASEESKYVH
jgi:hypothetical protein